MEHEFSCRTLRPEKQEYLLRCSIPLGNFPLKRSKKSCSFYFSTVFSGNLFGNGKQFLSFLNEDMIIFINSMFYSKSLAFYPWGIQVSWLLQCKLQTVKSTCNQLSRLFRTVKRLCQTRCGCGSEVQSPLLFDLEIWLWFLTLNSNYFSAKNCKADRSTRKNYIYHHHHHHDGHPRCFKPMYLNFQQLLLFHKMFEIGEIRCIECKERERIV